MRLEELHLDGFGRFHQQTIRISERVTVFYGPNEAGKSTLLAFVRAILFGFPTRGRTEHYPPLLGGRHGGRIRFSDDGGAVYTLERFAGARGGLTSLLTEAGETPDVATTLPRLTGHATPDLFKNVFAFSLDELQSDGLMYDSGISDRIYSAGLGVSKLPEFARTLSDRKEKLFRPRGSAQKITDSLRELENVDRRLQAALGNADEYSRLVSRQDEISQELAAATAELSRLNSSGIEIASLQTGWDDWIALTDCETRIGDIPRFKQFPENPTVRLESFEERARQGHEDLETAAEDLRKAEEAASAVIPDECLLDDANSIEHIRRARGSFDDSVHDLPERQTELRGLKAVFDKNLGELGHGWGETELQAFDTSVVARNQVDHWKQQLSESLTGSQRTQLQLEQDRLVLEGFQAEAQEAWAKLPPEPPLDSAALTQRQDILRACRGKLGDYERERQRHESLRDQLNLVAGSGEPGKAASGHSNLALLVLLGLAGVALVGAGIWLGGGALPLGIVGGLVLLATAAALLFSGRPSPSASPSPMAVPLGQQAAQAQAAANVAQQLLLESAVALGLPEQPNASALDIAESHLAAARQMLDTWTAATARVEETSRREKVQQGRVETAVLKHEAAEAAALESMQEWKQWLRERGLNETLTADTMTTFLPRVDVTLSSLAEAQRMGDRVAAIEHDMDEFRERVKPLAQCYSTKLDPDDHRQLAAAADELIKRLDETRTSVSNRERAKEQEEVNRQLLERQEQRLKQVALEIDALLAAGGATDTEEFRRRVRLHEQRQGLERRRDEYIRSLESISGPGDKLTAFRESLAGSDPSQLAEESEQLSRRQTEMDAQCNGLREERGGIDNELTRLTGEEESSALRSRRSTLFEQLQEQAREWSRLTIAEMLLEKTRHKFEQERQPSVIRHAQDFFSSVTGQRYTGLFAPLGEQRITVRDSTGDSRQPSELSRGTREQLYLALRFGLIREFGEHAERLPVVVDEALVNFDPERAKLAAESFVELSQTNQVLVFTCHPSTADMFAGAAGAQVVDISPSSSPHRSGDIVTSPPARK